MTTRRRAVALAVLAVLAVVTAAAPRASTAPSPGGERALLHLLSRTTFGPRPGDLARVGRIGAAAWLEEQLHPERVDDPACDAALLTLATLRMSIPELLREYPPAPTRACASR